MRVRSSETELLDEADLGQAEINASLDFMVGVNRRFGGTRAILDYFRRHAAERSLTVLDLGTGAGDIPRALVEWAESESKEIEVTALDVNPRCLAYARARHPSDRIRYLEHSAFRCEELGSFDYVVSSMFFHHLSDDEIVALLKTINRCARRGFVVNDLYRSRLHCTAAYLAALSTFKPVVVSDAPLSVRRGFREKDFERYRDASGISDLRIQRKPLWRLTMSRVRYDPGRPGDPR